MDGFELRMGYFCRRTSIAMMRMRPTAQRRMPGQWMGTMT